jgi:hypothetical protein
MAGGMTTGGGASVKLSMIYRTAHRVEGVSAEVYKAKAVHVLGKIEITGADVRKLIAEIETSATKMELE